MLISAIRDGLAAKKNQLIRRRFLACKDAESYSKLITFLRRHIKKKPSRIYYDYGVSTALKNLNIRPDTVFERLQLRLQAWYRDRDQRFSRVAGLVNKGVMRPKVESLKVPLPKLYYCDRDLTALDVDSLPKSFVAKPHNGADSKGVLVMNGSRDKLSGLEYDRFDPGFKEFLADFVLNAPGTNAHTKVLIEEFVVDSLNPELIPLDYKAHCYGGRAIFFQVINRNPGQRSQSFYTRDWRRLNHIIDDYEPGKTVPRPDCLNDLLHYADIIASDVKQMMRLDFYVTPNGPVFGEFTSYPAAGRNFNEYGNAISIQSWEVYPDEPSLY